MCSRHPMCGTRNWNAVPVRGAPGCTTATVWQSARTGLAMHETGERVVSHVDGERSAAGRVEATVPMIFSAEETTDLGEDTGTSVSDDYAPGQLVQRHGELGTDRHRRGNRQPGSSHHARGASPHRDGPVKRGYCRSHAQYVSRGGWRAGWAGRSPFHPAGIRGGHRQPDDRHHDVVHPRSDHRADRCCRRGHGMARTQVLTCSESSRGQEMTGQHDDAR